MKKLLTLALAAVLALSLVACGGSGSIKDGTYTAQYKEPSMIGRSICPSLIRTA